MLEMVPSQSLKVLEAQDLHSEEHSISIAVQLFPAASSKTIWHWVVTLSHFVLTLILPFLSLSNQVLHLAVLSTKDTVC